MSARIRRHLRSNVIGYVALFVALTGTAYAVDGPLAGTNQVGSEDIINGEVRTGDIAATAVNNAKLAPNAVNSPNVVNGSVATGDLAPDSVNGAKVIDASLAAADLAPNSVGASELQPGLEVHNDGYWAVVDADATLARASDSGVTATNPTNEPGEYVVDFNRPVLSCSYTATIGLSGSMGVSEPGFATVVAAAGGFDDRVFVETFDIAGNEAERGFHLQVAC